MIIRQAINADHPQLLDIWLRSVRATHHFLQASDIQALLPQLRDSYLPAVELWVAVDEEDPAAVGFYLHYGFVQTGRSPLDGEGRPFPLLHMSLPGQG